MTVEEAGQRAADINNLLAQGQGSMAYQRCLELQQTLALEVQSNPALAPNLAKVEAAIAQLRTAGVAPPATSTVPVAPTAPVSIPPPPAAMQDGTKRCPFCAEEILAAAIKCKHCGSAVGTSPAPLVAPVQPDVNQPASNGVPIIGVLVVIVTAFVYILMAVGTPSSVPTSGATAPDKQHHFAYVIKGTTDEAHLTYEGPGGSTEQSSASAIHSLDQTPWRKELSGPTGAWVYMSAQNQNDHGTVIVEIEVDGRVWKRAESDVGYGIASVSGSLP